MLKLEPIDYDESILTKYIYNDDGITATSGFEILDTNIDFIKDRIEFYIYNSSNLESVLKTTFTDELFQKKLKSMYTSKSSEIVSLKENIRKISKTVCAYCGTQDSPYQIDHYFPRSVFSEFSILSNNLIPSCATCNSRYKGDDYIFADGSRQFFNPYYDTFINTIQFLKCDITCIGIYIDIEFYIDASMELNHPNEYKLISNHFDTLQLSDRYSDLIRNDIFSEFYNEFVISVDIGDSQKEDVFMDVSIVELQNKIDERIRGLRLYNYNYWKKVFWESLKISRPCLNLIVNKVIPLR